MLESVLMKNPPKASESHKDQWLKQLAEHSGLKAIVEAVNAPKGKALIFSHDDPDGITSGLILKRALAAKGWKPVLKLPEGFMLSPQQWEQALKEHSDTRAVFISDKGTLAPYNAFGEKLPVYVIDHHPSPQAPDSCTIYNPALASYIPASTSLLAHGIATLCGTRDAFDDFLCLIGLKGDWTVEPIRFGVNGEFAKPFMVEYGMAYKKLFEVAHERPTMFDAEQREGTCLLSRVAEFVHAVGGGGFSYFYHDRDEALKGVDHAACIAGALEKMAGQAQDLMKLKSLEDFVKMLPKPEKDLLKKIYGFFLEDWEKASRLLDSSTCAAKLGDTAIYLFVGGKVPLLPMIGSIKLFDLKLANNDKFAQIIMISSVSPEYTHISVRASGDQVHSGKFCNGMQNLFHQKYAQYKSAVSGGGHPRAAECTVRTGGIPFLTVLSEALGRLGEMADIQRKVQDNAFSSELKKRAADLGLDYLNNVQANG